MHRQMAYILSTPDRGFVLNPKRQWDGKADSIELVISGEANSNYAKCPVTRRSISGNVTSLEGVAIIIKSIMQKLCALSVTKSELYLGVSAAQDVLYLMQLVESIGLVVQKPQSYVLTIRGQSTLLTIGVLVVALVMSS